MPAARPSQQRQTSSRRHSAIVPRPTGPRPRRVNAPSDENIAPIRGDQPVPTAQPTSPASARRVLGAHNGPLVAPSPVYPTFVLNATAPTPFFPPPPPPNTPVASDTVDDADPRPRRRPATPPIHDPYTWVFVIPTSDEDV